MTAWLCRLFGHRWAPAAAYAPKAYACTRCSEPGYWVDA